MREPIKSLPPLNILIAVDGIGPGGAEIAAIRLANMLAETNTVCVLNINEELFEKKYLGRLDKRVRYFHYLYQNSIADFLVWKLNAFTKKIFKVRLRDWLRKKWIKKLLKREKIQIINSHTFYTDVMFSAFKSDAALVSTLHGHYNDIYRRDKGLIKKNLPAIFHSVSQFIYLTETNRDIFRSEGFETSKNFSKIYTGYMARDIGTISGFAALTGIKERFIYGAIGRGVAEKGWRELLQAFDALNKKHSGIMLVCVGAKEFVDRLINEGNINTANIINLSAVEAVQEIIKVLHVTVLPSYFESLPNVIVESISLDVPVIATDVGEIRNMLDIDSRNPSGLVIPLDKHAKPDVAMLEKGMEKYLIDRETYIEHKKNTRSSFQKFSVDKCRKAYTEVFYKAMNKN